MKPITTLDEAMTFGLLSECIDNLKKDNTSSASHTEKINKLTKMKNEWLDKKTEGFLEQAK